MYGVSQVALSLGIFIFASKTQAMTTYGICAGLVDFLYFCFFLGPVSSLAGRGCILGFSLPHKNMKKRVTLMDFGPGIGVSN